MAVLCRQVCRAVCPVGNEAAILYLANAKKVFQRCSCSLDVVKPSIPYRLPIMVGLATGASSTVSLDRIHRGSELITWDGSEQTCMVREPERFYEQAIFSLAINV